MSYFPCLRLFATLFVLFALISCGGSGGDSSGSFRALIDGDVSSDLYSRLKEQYFSVTSYDGTQDLSGYDVVVVDANTNSAENIVEEGTLIRKALDLRVPVLIFNVFDSQIESELSKHTGLRFGGRHLAYLIGWICDQRGEQTYKLSPYSEFDVSVAQEISVERESDIKFIAGNNPDVHKHGQDDQVLDRLLTIYSDRIVQELSDDSGKNCDQSQPQGLFRDSTSSDPAPPQEVPYFHREVHWDFPVTIGGTFGFSTVTETVHIDFVIDAYYDNTAVPPEYKVFVYQDGQAYVDQNQVIQKPNLQLRVFQTEFFTNYQLAGTDGIFATQFAPSNVNQSETVTNTVSESISATVGYQTASVSGSYQTSRSVSQQISQWNIENSSPNATSREWHYYQAIFGDSFNSQPAISRQNLNYQNVALWIFPDGTKNFTLTASPARRFSNFTERRAVAQIYSNIVYPTPKSVSFDFPALVATPAS